MSHKDKEQNYTVSKKQIPLSENTKKIQLSFQERAKRPLLWLQVMIVIITLAVVGILIFLRSQTHYEAIKMAKEQFKQHQLVIARSTAIYLEAYYKELSCTLSSLAKIPSIQQMDSDCLQCIQHTYWGLPSGTSIRLLDSNGALRYIYPFEGWRKKLISKNYSRESYFKDIKKTGKISVSGLIANEHGDTRVRVAIPLYLMHKTEIIKFGDNIGTIIALIDSSKHNRIVLQGILVGSFDPYVIAKNFVSKIVSGKTGYGWILNEEGIFLAHYEDDFVGRNAFEVRKEKNPEISYEAIDKIQQNMIAGEEGVGYFTSGFHRGQKTKIENLVAYTPANINNRIWSVAVCAPVKEVEEAIHVGGLYEFYILILIILSLITGAFLFFLLTYRWSRSLEQEVKRRTDELRETSGYLNNLIKYANAPIIVWDPKKHITIFNEAFEKMSGWTEAEVKGEKIDMLFPEESYHDSMQKINAALKKGKYLKSIDIPILRKNGEVRIGLWNSANIYSENGKTLIATIAQGQDITDREKTEKELRISEEKYRTMIEHSNDMIWTLDEKENFLYFNKRSEEITGYKLKEWIGKSFAPLILDEDIKDVEKVFIETMQGKSRHYEVRLHNGSSNKILTLSVNTAPILKDGNVIGTVSFGRDITEQKQAEEAQIISEKRYWELANSLPEIIFEADINGNLTYVNNIAFELVGYSQEEFENGINIFQMIVPEDRDRVKDNIIRILNGEQIGGIEYTALTKEGRIFPVIAYATPIIHNDKIIGIRGIVVDITERKQAEDSLIAEKERLAVTLCSINDGMIATDVDGKIVLFNKIAVELTGWIQQEAISKPLNKIFQIIDERTHKPFKTPLDKVIKQGVLDNQDDNIILIAKDGTERSIAYSAAPIRDRKSEIIGMVLVFRDITEKRKTEEELQKMHKLESLGILAGGIAHDFNNIITVILGNISLAELNIDHDDETFSYMKDAEKAVSQAKDLAQQLLTFTKGGAPIRKTVSIIDLIKDSSSFVLRGSNVQCKFEISDDLLPVKIDEGQIKQVINNLIINANQAMPEGGIIKLRAENIELQHNNILPLPDGKYVKITIQDKGIGISEEHLQKIFDPYFTTKQAGSGLGLAICYSIIKKHNGYLAVESALGEGTTFNLYIPADNKNIRINNYNDNVLFSGKGKVLIMDDEEFIRKVGGEMLKHLGYTVKYASHGLEAIELYKKAMSNGSPFDLVIMDLTIPGKMGGKKAVKEFLRINPEIKVIVSSGYSNDPIMANFKEYGFSGSIAKPYKIEELSNVLNQMISNENDKT